MAFHAWVFLMNSWWPVDRKSNARSAGVSHPPLVASATRPRSRNLRVHASIDRGYAVASPVRRPEFVVVVHGRRDRQGYARTGALRARVLCTYWSCIVTWYLLDDCSTVTKLVVRNKSPCELSPCLGAATDGCNAIAYISDGRRCSHDALLRPNLAPRTELNLR